MRHQKQNENAAIKCVNPLEAHCALVAKKEQRLQSKY
jgi:hypothetical protein